MILYDRLSSLMARFEMQVAYAAPGTGNLRILGESGTGAPTRVTLHVRGSPEPDMPGETILIEARASWGGDANPLVAALPTCMSL